MLVRIGLVIAMACCTLSIACNKSSSPTVGTPNESPFASGPGGEEGSTVTAEAYQEFYITTSDNPDISAIAYRVIVTIKNTGTTAIVYDTVQAAFLPQAGKPLIVTTHPYDKSRHDEEEAYKKDRKTASIAPGAFETFSYTTNGYTFKLLRDAGDGPLEFVVILMKGDNPVIPVVGPYAAVLPSPKDLPQYEQSMRQKTSGKTLSLRYSRKKQ